MRTISLRSAQRNFQNQKTDAILVNVARVKHNFYDKELAEVMRGERLAKRKNQSLAVAARNECISTEKEKKLQVMIAHLKKEDKQFAHYKKKRTKKTKEEENITRAKKQNDKHARMKLLIKVVVLAAQMKVWQTRATRGEGSLKNKKKLIDAARKIQNLFRHRKTMLMGQRFRDAVLKLKFFVCKFIDAWRLRRLNGAGNVIFHFLQVSERSEQAFWKTRKLEMGVTGDLVIRRFFVRFHLACTWGILDRL